VTSDRRWVITTQGIVVALLIGGSIIILAAGERARLPDSPPFDAEEQGAVAVDRAFDFLVAAFALIEAAAVPIAVRGWLRSGRWTIPFLCDLTIAIPAALVISPAGPALGGLTTPYLAVLAVGASMAALAVLRRTPVGHASVG
jgi:hypothetical protein